MERNNKEIDLWLKKIQEEVFIKTNTNYSG